MAHVRQILVLAGFALATACGGGDGTDPGPQLPRLLYNDPSSGNSQTDTVGATLPVQLSVKVLDSTNTAVQNHTITWTVPVGQGSVSSPTTNTNASGVASVTRTLGTTAGTQTAQAVASGVTGSPKGFTTTATAGAAVDINKSATVDTASTVRTTVPYTVVSVDSHGNPKAGVVIDWLPADSMAPAQNTTGADGTASATRTLSGSEGEHTATATAGGLTGAPSETFTTQVVTLPTAASVSVDNNIFAPGNVKVAMGAAVTWTWVGTVDVYNPGHNVTFSAGTGGAPLNCATTKAAGAKCVRTFSTAATFRYRCTNHSTDFTTGMVGSVTVQ
jgi:plastocyanin